LLFNVSINIGLGDLPRPQRVTTVDVLLREGPLPFGKQNASHQRRLSLAATNHLMNLKRYRRTAPKHSWITPLVAASD
jgi:hypothetical protein